MVFPFKAPPFANSNLKPQKSNNYEIGAYQIFQSSNNFTAELSLSVYQTDIKDEIDFDLNTFTYQNIQSSRHRGFEGGLNIRFMNNWNSFINYTYSEVKFRSGQYNGNYLKGIPKNIISIGLSYFNPSGFRSSVSFLNSGGIFLDDENTMELAAYNWINLRLAYKINIFDFILDFENLFDKEYSTTGFLLNGEKYFYPAAGRIIRGGVKLEF
jgi:outer membrane receptor protein involved in Fe transport